MLRMKQQLITLKRQFTAFLVVMNFLFIYQRSWYNQIKKATKLNRLKNSLETLAKKKKTETERREKQIRNLAQEKVSYNFRQKVYFKFIVIYTIKHKQFLITIIVVINLVCNIVVKNKSPAVYKVNGSRKSSRTTVLLKDKTTVIGPGLEPCSFS